MVQDNGFRDGQKEKLLKQMKNSLNIEEALRIEEQRKFDMIESGTWEEKIALYQDTLRNEFRLIDMNIRKVLWNIEDISNNITRCKAEITSGNIRTKLVGKDELMNEAELRTYIKHQEWLLFGEVRSLPVHLGKLRAIVGHKDLKRQVVMSREQYVDYVEKINKELMERGFTLCQEFDIS